MPITPRVVPTRQVTSSGETRAAPALGNNGGEMGGVTRNVRGRLIGISFFLGLIGLNYVTE